MIIEKASFSIVIPCYNSAKSLPELINRIDKTFSDTPHEIEIILINDGSADNTWDVIQTLGKKYPQLVGINLLHNVGQQSAVLCGFDQARFDYLVTIDDDLQHAPEDILLLYQNLIDKDLDLVIARLDGKQHGYIRNLGTKFVQHLARQILTLPHEFHFSSFRLMKKFVAKKSLEFKVMNPVIGFLVVRTTNNFANYRVTHLQRKHGTSNYSFYKLINLCVTMIVDYASLPIKLVINAGVLIALLIFGMSSFYLMGYLSESVNVWGFTLFVLMICFFLGLLCIFVAIIGTYLSRLSRSNDTQPLYVIREKINLPKAIS